MLTGDLQIRPRQTAQRINRECRRVDKRGEALPPERLGLRVRIGPSDRREQRIVEPEARRAQEIVGVVARGPDHVVGPTRAPAQSGERLPAEVQAVTRDIHLLPRIAIQDETCTALLAEQEGAPRQIAVGRVIQLMRTHLNEPDPARDGARETREKHLGVERVGTRNQHAPGQTQRGDDGTIGRWKAGRIHRLGALPGKGLAFETGWNAHVRADPPHVEQDMPVAVMVSDADQRTAVVDLDTQLFGQLACQAVLGRLAGLKLAARKLPQPALMDVIRAFGHQNTPVLVEDRADHHMNQVDAQLRYSALIRT